MLNIVEYGYVRRAWSVVTARHCSPHSAIVPAATRPTSEVCAPRTQRQTERTGHMDITSRRYDPSFPCQPTDSQLLQGNNREQ